MVIAPFMDLITTPSDDISVSYFLYLLTVSTLSLEWASDELQLETPK
jgi:hypothetical protein